MGENMNKNMRENVVLIGMMGVGKTALGRQLSELLDYEFVDLEAKMEDVCRLKLNEAYRKYGKIRFWAEETLLLKKQHADSGLVLATGGALLPNDEQLALWQALGRTVWLKAAPDTMIRRIKRKHNQIFLLPNKTQEEFVAEIARRSTIYASVADYTLDLDRLSPEEAARKICDFLQKN